MLPQVNTQHAAAKAASAAAVRAGLHRLHMTTTDTAAADIKQLKASAIKAELDTLGVSYSDCFEKGELVQRLVDARAGGASSTKAAAAAAPDVRSEPQQQPQAEAPQAQQRPPSPAADPAMAEIKAMRTSAIKQELMERGVGYSDLVSSL